MGGSRRREVPLVKHNQRSKEGRIRDRITQYPDVIMGDEGVPDPRQFELPLPQQERVWESEGGSLHPDHLRIR